MNNRVFKLEPDRPFDVYPRPLSRGVESIAVFCGNANPQLAKEVVSYLGVPMGNARVDKFSDGEVEVELLDSVRGKDVFVIQPTCAPVNRNLMELLVMCDALRRSSAKRVTAVIPYFGYARQDRRSRFARVPITAKVVADMISVAGASRVLTIDLHADQIQGFFDIPVDNIYASLLILGDIWKRNRQRMVVVSPDVGGVLRARAMAKRCDDANLAIIDKRRPQANESEVMNIIGDVRDRDCVIVDDIADTSNTLCNAATALKDEGAQNVIAYTTHAVLSGKAIERIKSSVLDELIVTNTIPLSAAAIACDQIRQLSVAQLLAETIRRINQEEPISSLLDG